MEQRLMKRKILVLTPYFLPGVKGGGPIQSIKNLTEWLGDKYEFYLITNFCDLGDTEPYSNISIDKWIKKDRINIYYTNIKHVNSRKLISIINQLSPDILYLNSFFHFKLSILPIILFKTKKLNIRGVILAPRGEFSQGALSLKSTKKILYINIAKIFKLYKNILWQATADTELRDINSVMGNKSKIKVASNFPKFKKGSIYPKRIQKESGELKIVFISRIHPKKNLHFALQLLSTLNGKVEFNIYGPIEDRKYWDGCLEIINNLGKNINVVYNGVIMNDDISSVFTKNHLFLFPTLGENFGHVIFESMLFGCPVVISDRTPWKGLESKGAGSVITLENKIKYIQVIQKYINMDNNEYNKLSKNAYKYGQDYLTDKSTYNQNKELFERGVDLL
jgi:glycosyltransferase involved in cell wall biosynthesis